MSPGLRLVARLSLRDLMHERRLTACSCIALAAVLTPLILLFGLKNGVVEGIRADLIENPRVRMIVNASNQNFKPAFLDELARRADVAFVAPRLRTLNSEARFERTDRPGTVRRAELLATGAGDPLLGGLPAPVGPQVVASHALAGSLELQPGASLVLRAGRSQDREILSVPLTLIGVAPAAALGRDAMFVDLRLVLLVDGFIESTLPATATLEQVVLEPDRNFAGFRAHARRLEDVLTLESVLRRQDVDVETQAADVAALLGLNRSLIMLFALLAGLGASGYLVSLGTGLYANVERKQGELSLLRLVGLLRRNLVVLPVLQAAIIAASGAVVAALVALVCAELLNRLAVFGLDGNRPVCLIEPWHLAVAFAASIVGAAVAAGFAAQRAARVQPAEGLRNA